MQWLAEKNTGHAEKIRGMFMPRKVFDYELRQDRLSSREAAVRHYASRLHDSCRRRLIVKCTVE